MALFNCEGQVYDALLPWLGSHFLENSSTVSAAVALLRSFPSQNGDFSLFHNKIEKQLFMSVYHGTKGSMEINIGTKCIRIHSSAFIHMADDVLAVHFMCLKPTFMNFELLKRYSMENESLAALHALYLAYDHLQSPEEIAFIKRMIASIYPPWRYEKWIDEKQETNTIKQKD